MTQELIREAKALCAEIGLQTYGRKPAEMLQTSADWKLQRAEAMVRDIKEILDRL